MDKYPRAALCINFIVKWALHCSQMIASRSSGDVAEEVPHCNGLDKSAMKALPTVAYARTQSQHAQKPGLY